MFRRRRKKREEAEGLLQESQERLQEAEGQHAKQKRLKQQEDESVTGRLRKLAQDSGNHLAMEFLEAFTEGKRGEN